MADIRRIDGKKTSVKPSKRNQSISECLAELIDKNDQGGIMAMIGVYIRPDGAWGAFWRFPSRKETNLPWDLALMGALIEAQHEFGNAVDEAPPFADDDA